MPIPFQFDELDVLRTFICIDKKPVSRAELVKQLEIGEGSLKTILELLKQKNLVTSSAMGHCLTAEGEKQRKKVCSMLTLPQEIKLSVCPGEHKIAVLIKTPKQDINYQHRDLALKYGADGALLFKYTRGYLKLPYGEKFQFKELEKLFNYTDGDVLVITFGRAKKDLYRAALAVAQKLCSVQEII